MAKKIFVTGAGGYIGTTLVPMLVQRGYRVIALDNYNFGQELLTQALGNEVDQVDIVKGDIRTFNLDLLNGVYGVIDLAALSNDPAGDLDPEKTREINHRGRVRIAKAAKERGVKRYVLPSSCSIYGFLEPGEVADETYKPNPLTIYAEANLAAENDILPLSDREFSAVAFRQATVYGASKRMRFDLAINGMVKGFIQNGKIPILKDGEQFRPFVHVADTSRALILGIEAPADLVGGEIFNVGSNDNNVQIFPLAERVAAAIGLPFEYEWYGQPDHRSYKVSFDKINKILDYTIQVSIEDGAREVYEGLKSGALDANDPRTITLGWYKHLLEQDPTVLDAQVPSEATV